jgi:hypothetical protein
VRGEQDESAAPLGIGTPLTSESAVTKRRMARARDQAQHFLHGVVEEFAVRCRFFPTPKGDEAAT